MASATADTEGEPGSLSILLQKATQGDQRAGNELLRRLQSNYADRITANLHMLQAADRDAIASEMLYRLYSGLVSGRFTQARNRGDLFKLIGGINYKCRIENWREKNTQKARILLSGPLPEHELEDPETAPDELAEVEDFIRHLSARVDSHIRNYPADAFLRPMLAMILEDCSREEIMAAEKLSRHKYQSRFELLIRIGRDGQAAS
ncbi:MAG UNVERIFIED_CONTAM: hypothetical protein LVR18_09325 [Planctomycetaceae bacterium]|jgi:DNA-directed RNA polymerase specialized sigma24 family protein